MTFNVLNKGIARVLIAAVFITFCGLSELATAQAAQTPEAQQTNASAQSSTPDPPAQSQAPRQTAPQGTVDPSAGPLAPVPSTPQELPGAPSSTPGGTLGSTQNDQNSTDVPPRNPAWQQPVGTAGAQAGPTAGGAASKPAGFAIAPAKQHQTRSFLIKLGAVAAAGVAIGTIVALSRGTGSNPPGAK